MENVIRDIDADLAKLARAEPGRNAQKLVFPNGYGPEIDPEGASQLENLPKLRQRISSVGPHAVVTEALAKFDAAVLIEATVVVFAPTNDETVLSKLASDERLHDN